jgi:hypothetical protein
VVSYLFRYSIIYVAVLILFIPHYMVSKKIEGDLIIRGMINIFSVAIAFCVLATIAERFAIRFARPRAQWPACITLLLVIWGVWRFVVLQRVMPSYWPPTCGIMVGIWAGTFWISVWYRQIRQSEIDGVVSKTYRF